LLQETAAYAESTICRRKLLLHYFGEEYNEDNCGNCDNCLHPKKKEEASQQLQDLLHTILALKDDFKTDYIMDVLFGRDTDEVQAHNHDTIEEFGIGSDNEECFWDAVFRQALIDNYIRKDVENYGLIKITAKGHNFLKKPHSFLITENNVFDEEVDDDSSEGGTAAIDPVLSSMLKDLRRDMSKKYSVPPYVIFQDPSIEAMATVYPINIDELQNIQGVGLGKAKRYGQPFCDLIKKHCEENDIERPEDLRVRTVANKSKLKVSIIQSIDLKVALDDLADSKGMDFSELLDEIDAIVYSGTKLNIDYFLNDIMDEDHINDIYDYFRESETDDLNTAMDELGDDYTEEEIRLVRIKFLSELAN
jgi:ATP-dependent DNA helicase RecQ